MKPPSPPPASRACTATKKDGAPCPNKARNGSTVCGLHDPVIQASAKSAGGKARAASLAPACLGEEEAREIIRLREAKDVPGTLEEIARAVACGRLDVRAGNAIVGAASAAVRAADAADLSRRVELLESALNRGRR